MNAHRRPLVPIALTPRHRRIIFAAGLALVATGVAWLLCRYFLRADGDMADLPHAWEPFWMKVHGGAAMLSLIVVGSLLPWHAWRAWQVGRNRGTGLIMASTVLLLALSGWALYYVGSEDWRPVIGAAHWIVGLLGVPALVWHVVAARRRRMVRQREHGVPAFDPG